MKKYMEITLIIICLLALTACVNKKEIMLPEVENITEVEIMESTSETSKIINTKEEISKLVNAIKDNSENTNKESANDQPTNVDSYIIIKFYHKDEGKNPSVAYLYKEKGNCYIEQPYTGIWKLKQGIFNNISDLISKK
ncbi:DUF5301 domain-containing protein [Filifactor alocis]